MDCSFFECPPKFHKLFNKWHSLIVYAQGLLELFVSKFSPFSFHQSFPNYCIIIYIPNRNCLCSLKTHLKPHFKFKNKKSPFCLFPSRHCQSSVEVVFSPIIISKKKSFLYYQPVVFVIFEKLAINSYCYTLRYNVEMMCKYYLKVFRWTTMRIIQKCSDILSTRQITL